MTTIGFRAEPDGVTFAVYDSDQDKVVNIECIKIPNALTVPERLRYLRSTVLDILNEYSVDKAVVRVPESIAQSVKLARTQYEAIIQEAFASSSLRGYALGQIASITALAGMPRVDFKLCVDQGKDFDRVENWTELKSVEKEAVLAAIGAQNVETL